MSEKRRKKSEGTLFVLVYSLLPIVMFADVLFNGYPSPIKAMLEIIGSLVFLAIAGMKK